MSATGLEVFDRTLQATHIWLDDIMAELGPDRQRAYHVLRAVLHALRDRLPVVEAAHLGAQLPMLVRGIYYEGWRPQVGPTAPRHLEGFLERVGSELQGIRPISPEQATRTVSGTIVRHVNNGEARQVAHLLPEEIRSLWPVQ
jgi:uncharacterized protein (DUF2267 family)